MLRVQGVRGVAGLRHAPCLVRRQGNQSVHWAVRLLQALPTCQVKSSQFMFSNFLVVTIKEERKQNKNLQNHALKKVAMSQQNKECLHKSRFVQSRIHCFIQHTHHFFFTFRF